MAVEVAVTRGSNAAPICFETLAGARIDPILCNASAASVVRNFAVLDDTGLPTHSPIGMGMSVELYRQTV